MLNLGTTYCATYIHPSIYAAKLGYCLFGIVSIFQAIGGDLSKICRQMVMKLGSSLLYMEVLLIDSI